MPPIKLLNSRFEINAQRLEIKLLFLPHSLIQFSLFGEKMNKKRQLSALKLKNCPFLGHALN
jgi:hypothetical protein